MFAIEGKKKLDLIVKHRGGQRYLIELFLELCASCRFKSLFFVNRWSAERFPYYLATIFLLSLMLDLKFLLLLLASRLGVKARDNTNLS